MSLTLSTVRLDDGRVSEDGSVDDVDHRFGSGLGRLVVSRHVRGSGLGRRFCQCHCRVSSATQPARAIVAAATTASSLGNFTWLSLDGDKDRKVSL
jgi:predicted GNAT family N-acyltransferase